MNKYYKQYKWSNIFAMFRNQKLEPKVCKDDFQGCLVVITGATSGIGYDAAMKYASHGAEILSVNRNEEKSKKLCETLTGKYGVKCSYILADFSKLDDVHRVGKQLAESDRHIHVLIHNAGVYLTKKTVTDDGLEQVLQTNYLSTFILNYYLKDKFIEQNSGRIIYVNSEAHRFAAWGIHMDDLAWDKHKYSGIKSYGTAKMAQLLSMIKFNEYFIGTGVTINAMHPGNVKTNSGRTNGKLYRLFKKAVIDRSAISIEKSSEALYYLGVSKEVGGMSGRFFNLTTLEEPAPPALDEEAAERLWRLSLDLGNLQMNPQTRSREKVVIVGAGMAGLTAAAYLTRQDYDVVVIEKNKQVGGLVGTFSRAGFSFDTGPRAFVNSGMVNPILKDLGIEWEIRENIITLRVEDNAVRIDSMKALGDYKRMLYRLYPESKTEIDKIIKQVYHLSQNTRTLYEFDNPYFVDYTSDKVFLLTKFLPWTFRLLYVLGRFKKFSMPMEDYLLKQTKNISLINILTQFFFRKTPTYFALGYFHVWMDYFYPKGGTGTLPSVVCEKVLTDGGSFVMDTRVNQVIPSESKIIDANGNSHEYDHLIWAADLKTLYDQLDMKGLNHKTLSSIKDQKRKVFAAKPAESSFILNLAVNRPPSYFENICGAHSFYTPSKRGLGQVTLQKKEDLLNRFDQMSEEEILAWVHDFCDYNTYEVSIPVLRDASLAPEGKTGIMISCLFDYEVMVRMEKAGLTDTFKKAMEKRIVSLFSKSLFVGLDKDVVFSFSTTPLTINSMIGSTGGAIVGWSFETEAPVYNQLTDMPKCAQTPIPNVYQAGQWAYAPAGVPIAMLTGWHASQEIAKR